MDDWTAEAVAQVKADQQTAHRLFPVAARRGGPSARAALLGHVDAATVAALYRNGDAGERLAVLDALDRLDLGDAALPLVEDALRTNDARLVAAALGPYGARVLDDHAYRQGVLKCVFMAIPLERVAGLDERFDPELARMLAAYADERRAAGRTVPPDVLERI
ncbi:EboA domain-containing protein [Nonomuraea sp. NPDC003804]|uniref:EboA domain-containing protein n=1 Tax=Nonomuraea sp. NPDC003804 TaxID=3154547 RepID=UPI0033BF8705